MRYPLENFYRVKRGYVFGSRTWYSSFHYGLDLVVPIGTPCYAIKDGIIKSLWGYQGGRTAHLITPENTYRYLHLSKVLKIGKVKEGDIIALSGNTGRYTSEKGHLHWDVSKNKLQLNNYKNFINPIKYFRNMEYVIIKETGNQYLLSETYKIAISLADPIEVSKLLKRGLIDKPKEIKNVDGYLIYPGLEVSRIRDLFNL